MDYTYNAVVYFICNVVLSFLLIFFYVNRIYQASLSSATSRSAL